MIDLVKYIVSQIVDNPDDIQIEEHLDENNTNIITLSVNPDDMGKVIGKGGKIIGAVRELVKIKAIKQGKRVRVILEDPVREDQVESELEPITQEIQPEATTDEVPAKEEVTELNPEEITTSQE